MYGVCERLSQMLSRVHTVSLFQIMLHWSETKLTSTVVESDRS